ncbi:MAG TPA: hypothetical protein VFM79_06275 [Pelobium sp.]|nr:hypothetical protein [Pelobium sp.]
MKKIIILFSVLFVLILQNKAQSQTISPDINQEYCPNGTLIIPVDKLNNGTYLMKLFNGSVWSTEKIMVQH